MESSQACVDKYISSLGIAHLLFDNNVCLIMNIVIVTNIPITMSTLLEEHGY
jgi:hypothetical protein